MFPLFQYSFSIIFGIMISTPYDSPISNLLGLSFDLVFHRADTKLMVVDKYNISYPLDRKTNDFQNLLKLDSK